MKLTQFAFVAFLCSILSPSALAASSFECSYSYTGVFFGSDRFIEVNGSWVSDSECANGSCLQMELRESYLLGNGGAGGEKNFHFERKTLAQPTHFGATVDLTFTVPAELPLVQVQEGYQIRYVRSSTPVPRGHILPWPMSSRLRLTIAEEGNGLLTDLDRYEACLQTKRNTRDCEMSFRYPVRCKIL